MTADAKPAEPVNIFAKLYGAGFTRLVPVLPCDASVREGSSLNRTGARGKAVGVRGRDGLWHGYDWVRYECELEDLERWHAMGADIGIKGGVMPDGNTLVFIDADTKNYLRSTLIEKHVGLLVPGVPKRIGQAPKAAYPVRVAGPYAYSRIEFGDRDDKNKLSCRVEILGESRYLKVHGIHPDTGEAYTWPVPLCPYDKLPIVTPEQLDQLLRDLAEVLPAATEIRREGAGVSGADVDQESLRGDPELVAKMVRATPNTTEAFPTRESYRDFGYAIKASMPDDEPAAFALFEDWCGRWEDGDNPEDVVASDWRRMKPPFKRGFRYLVQQCEAASGGAVGRADVYFDAEAAAAQPKGVDSVEAIRAMTPKANKPKLELIAFDDAADAALTNSSRPLVKGLLDQGAMSVLYGESNAGKTFVTMDLAYHIARGLPWGGMRTTAGVVAYLASEGGEGAKKRAAALRAKHGPCSGFHFILCPVDLRDPKADLKPLLDLLHPIDGLLLVVIDTLSRAMAGGDENSSVDMGALVQHFDIIRAVTSAHLLVVHHTGKDLAKGARGHSLLRAATDTEIEVVPGGISVTKQRDLEKEWRSGFTLESMTLGVNDIGDVVTSAVVNLVEGVVIASPDKVGIALENVRRGEWRKDVRSGEAWVGHPIASGLGLSLDSDADKDRIKGVITAWLKEGRLIEEMRVNKARQSKVYVTVPSSIFD